MRIFFGLNASGKTLPSFLLGSLFLLVFTLLCPLTVIGAVVDQSLREQAVKNARQGRVDDALHVLAPLYDSHPENIPLAYDYLVVLTWAGRDDDALRIFDRLTPENIPAYVLEAAGKAARNVRNFDRAEQLYRQGLERFPENIQLAIGLVYSLADQGRFPEAKAQLDALRLAYPRNVDIPFALAYICEGQKSYPDALQAYDRVLALDPQSLPARRKRILILDAMGASHLAYDEARKSPELFSERELIAMEANTLTFDVRWGGMAPEKESARFVQTDQALEKLDAFISRLEMRSPEFDDYLSRARIDRLVALHNRLRMTEVVSEYQTLQGTGGDLPFYVLSAVGDAYLYLDYPESARDLYLQALQKQPGDFDTEMNLFYAYVDLDDFPAAFEIVDRLNQAEKPWLHTAGIRAPTRNPHKVQTESAAAMARAYADMLDPAQRRIEALHGEAPYNLELRQDLASIYEYRGWPRRARKAYRLGMAQPEEIVRLGLEAGYARTQFALNEFQPFEQTMFSLVARYPREKTVQRLQYDWQVHNLRQLIVEAGFAKSPNAGQSNRDINLSATLFSSPVRYNTRFFTGFYLAQARFAEGTETYRRYGVGLEYRVRDLEAVAEATYNQDGVSKPGFRLEGTWFVNDQWSIATELEKFSRETPLRALKHGIDANSLVMRVRYRVSDEQHFSLGYQGMDFSDGNLRQALSADWFQRLYTAPAYKLNSILEFYGSKNSENNTPYFNPQMDFSASLTLENIWRQWRRYSCSLHHRLALTLGDYWQQDYGTGVTGSILYEQRWNAHDRLEFLYGGSLGHRIYDGDSENYYALHMRLDWRF